ncbi:MAG: hypothetical protein VB070_07985 [Clostridiaceae bacterium]|nr:hypothetical protein [Clostridiaceae bacterium]
MKEEQCVQTAEKNTHARNRRIRRAVGWTAAVALLLIIAWILFTHYFRVGEAYQPDCYGSLLEVNGQTYVMRRDGLLLRWQEPDRLEEITNLPAEFALTDGTAIYYAKGKSICRYQVGQFNRPAVWTADKVLTLDYIDANVMLFHKNNCDDFTWVDRKTGQSRLLFADEQNRSISFASANENTALYMMSDNGHDRLIALDLRALQSTCLHEGNLGEAEILNDKVYFTIEKTFADGVGVACEAAELWSVGVDGRDLRQIDLSKTNSPAIQWFALAGPDILIATDDYAQTELNQNQSSETGQTLNTNWQPEKDHHGSIYRYRPQTGTLEKIGRDIGLISSFQATGDFYCYYDLGNGRVAAEPVLLQLGQ